MKKKCIFYKCSKLYLRLDAQPEISNLKLTLKGICYNIGIYPVCICEQPVCESFFCNNNHVAQKLPFPIWLILFCNMYCTMGILLASSKCIEGKIYMHNLKFYPSRLQQKMRFLLYIDGSSYCQSLSMEVEQILFEL